MTEINPNQILLTSWNDRDAYRGLEIIQVKRIKGNITEKKEYSKRQILQWAEMN